MAKDKADPKDPRFKHFRVAAYAIYIVIVTLFSTAVIASVFRSVAAMSPPRSQDPERTLTERECVNGLRKLWVRLDEERQDFSTDKPSENVDERFTRFRELWLKDFRALEGQCALGTQGREALKASFSRLDRLMDLYMTHAVQYAAEVGPAVDGFNAAFEAAQKDAQGPRK